MEADGKYYVFVQTNKKAEEHHEENNKGKEESQTTNFEKIEIVKGSYDMGYTAITPVTPIPPNAKIVVKGAFFVNAKLSNSGDHAH